MALFDKFRDGLAKTRDFLTRGVERMAMGLGFFDEEQIDDLEVALIQTDMGFDIVEEVMTGLREEIQRTGNNRSDFVHDYLAKAFKNKLGDAETLELKSHGLNVLLMVGVNGTGKTTSAGKIANRFKRQGKTVMMAAADTFRAAAIEQLEHWAKAVGCRLIAHKEGSDPAAVVYDAMDAALSTNTDLLIVDTAGRLHNKKNLMEELAKIHRIIERRGEGKAHVQSLLVLDATNGQNAVLQAQAFNEVTELDGIILTKLDGSAKGGVALAVNSASKLPILLAGLGEGIDDLVDFDPDSYVEALLPRN